MSRCFLVFKSMAGWAVLMVMLSASLACQTGGGSGVAPAVPVTPANEAAATAAVGTAAGPAPVTLVTETPQPAPAAETSAPVAAPHPSWVEYRDPRYGYGLARPCWWQVIPAPLEGYGGVTTLRSYDEAFFQAHSTKGEWTGGAWPAGAVKVDVGVMEGVPAGQPVVEALRQGMDPTLEAIVGSQERAFGAHLGTLVEIDDTRNPDDPNTVVVVFRLSQDKLLRFSALPGTAILDSDLQQVMGSLALTPDQPVQLPAAAPSPSLVELPPGCVYP